MARPQIRPRRQEDRPKILFRPEGSTVRSNGLAARTATCVAFRHSRLRSDLVPAPTSSLLAVLAACSALLALRWRPCARRARGQRTSLSTTAWRWSWSRTGARRSSPICSGTRSAPPTSRRASPGIAHFLEHLMFKGTAEESGRPLLADPRDHRRPGERLHVVRLHRLFPAHVARASADADGVRVRPHDRPRAHRRATCCSELQVVLEEENHARRQRSRRQARIEQMPPRSTSIIPTDARSSAGARRSSADARGRARLLRALLHAQQRRRWSWQAM